LEPNVSENIEFAYFQKVLQAGEKKISDNFKTIFAQFAEAQKKELSEQQRQDLDTVIVAYKLAHELSMSAFQFKKTLQAQHTQRR
jgi:hypothetical protein